jgi:hypothetical protein
MIEDRLLRERTARWLVVPISLLLKHRNRGVAGDRRQASDNELRTTTTTRATAAEGGCTLVKMSFRVVVDRIWLEWPPHTVL